MSSTFKKTPFLKWAIAKVSDVVVDWVGHRVLYAFCPEPQCYARLG